MIARLTPRSPSPPLLLQSVECRESAHDARPPSRRFHGDTEAAEEWLLGNHIDATFGGLTLLHWAISWSDVALVELLLERRADTNCVTNDGKFALLCAVNAQRSLALVGLLIKHAASLDTHDDAGCTALMHACAHGKGKVKISPSQYEDSARVVELLMAAGADFRIRDKSGKSAMGYAWPNLCLCPGEDGAVVKRLIGARADVDERHLGVTLALHAARRAHVSLFRFCLDAGADISAQVVDNKGRNVLEMMVADCDETCDEYMDGTPWQALLPALAGEYAQIKALVLDKIQSIIHSENLSPTKRQMALGWAAQLQAVSPSEPAAAAASPALPGGFQVGDVVWTSADLLSSVGSANLKETLVYAGCRGTVLGPNSRDAARMRVKFEQAGNGTGTIHVNVLPASHVTRAPPLKRGGLAVGDACWAARDLYIDLNSLTGAMGVDRNARGSRRGYRVAALTRGTVIGLPIGRGVVNSLRKVAVAVLFERDHHFTQGNVGSVIARRELSQRLASDCIAEAEPGLGFPFPDVCSTMQMARECQQALQSRERALEEERALRNESAREGKPDMDEQAKQRRCWRKKPSMDEARKLREVERAKAEMAYLELELINKENARRKADEESAQAKARSAKAKADAKEAAKAKAAHKAAEVQHLVADGPAIYGAAAEGSTKTLKQLLKKLSEMGKMKRKELLRWRHTNGETPLYCAASRGHAAVVALLLDAQFSMDDQLEPASCGLEGATPLYAACEAGSVEVVRLLLKRGAEPEQMAGGRRLGEVALEKGHVRISEMLQSCAEKRAIERHMAAEEMTTRMRELARPRGQTPSSSAPGASGASLRFQPALNAIAEDAEGDEKEDEADEPTEEGSNEYGSAGDKAVEEDLEEDLADIDESSVESSAYWERQLDSATSAEELREAISAIELIAREAGVSADCIAPLLPLARERYQSLHLYATTSLLLTGCDLPSDVLERGVLSLGTSRKGSDAFVTAHTILLVDCSGSMSKADVVTAPVDNGGATMQTRASAVLGLLSRNFVRTQIEAGAVSSERVSLIKIQGVETAASLLRALPFALLPIDHKLAGKIDAALGEPRSHGPYLPALSLLAKLIELCAPYLVPRAKTNVLFLSDGRPSDRVDSTELPGRLKAALGRVHDAFVSTHTFLESFQLLGFGEADEKLLKLMAGMMPSNVATYSVGSGAGSYESLAQSVSAFASSVAISRISSVSHIGGKSRALRRSVSALQNRICRYRDCEVFLPPTRLGDFVSAPRPLRGLHDVEIAGRMLGHGGERNAFLMRFLTPTRFTTCDEEWVVKVCLPPRTGLPLASNRSGHPILCASRLTTWRRSIAQESRHSRTTEEEDHFHRKALVTQKAAEELANRFNQEAESLGLAGLPKVAYMTCCHLQTERMELRIGEVPDPDEPVCSPGSPDGLLPSVSAPRLTNLG